MLIALGAAAVVSLIYILGILDAGDSQVYDLFLRWRPKRERFDGLVFVDVDDLAITHIGVFPWPRSVMADGLLRLKEYSAQSVVFDIEYVEKSPPGVDTVFLERGLAGEFTRSFGGISANVSDLLSALSQGRVSMRDSVPLSQELLEYIDYEREYLYQKAEGIARDNDLYLAQASSLYGNSWGTLNLQREFPLEEALVSRRDWAQENFSYPVAASPDAVRGNDIDVLPPIFSFMQSNRGAGFTNVTIDEDGVRRRIYLAREINGYWYLQLAFAPLIEYLGNPSIELQRGTLTLKNAWLPQASSGTDIAIPLDQYGAMYLDWPTTSFRESYSHLSFAALSYLDEYENTLEDYLAALASSEAWYFPDDTGLLYQALRMIREILDALALSREYKTVALEENSQTDFELYVEIKNQALIRTRTLSNLSLEEPLIAALESLALQYPAESEYIWDEGDYVLTILDYTSQMLRQIEDIQRELRAKITGKIAIIGRVDTGTTDIGVNPFYPEYVNVGTHGVVIDTIISQSFIIRLSRIWSIAFTIALVPLLILLLTNFKPGVRASLGFSGIFVILGATFLLFYAKGIFFGPLGLILSLATAVIVREVFAFIGSEQEKQFIRKAFSTYLSGDVVEIILNNPAQLKLGGEKRLMTAVFTDIRGFSSISEQLDPEDLVKLLNSYLSAMSNVILDNGGTIDKYEGDAIIAFFGAPLLTPDHALRACTSAILMKRVEEELNREYKQTGLSPLPVFTRIGINTGEMVVGNMGTEKKMDYTIMGNAVNIAARLEGVNKQYGTWLLTSEDTLSQANGQILSRRLDAVRVVGINEPVQLHELVNLLSDATDLEKELVDLFHKALEIFHARDWKGAEAAFLKSLYLAPEDVPSRIFLERCQEYQQTPPVEDWDGVIDLTSK